MKYISITMIVLFAMFWSYGCDSVTDSKPVNTTPPVLTAPPDNDTNQSLNPVFRWTGSADKLEVSRSPDFSDIIHSTSVTGNEYTYPGTPPLSPRTYYYWRAGITAGTTTTWSQDYFTFRTQ